MGDYNSKLLNPQQIRLFKDAGLASIRETARHRSLQILQAREPQMDVFCR